VGPTADALAQATRDLEAEGLRLIQVRRDWDSRFWPLAKAGFFAFRKQIPALLEPGRSR
jgi:deoxyribodipyrimidine photo-lyase